jgi:hypothetical protein
VADASVEVGGEEGKRVSEEKREDDIGAGGELHSVDHEDDEVCYVQTIKNNLK